MLRFYVIGVLVFVGAVALMAAAVGGARGWLIVAALAVVLLAVAVHDVVQTRHAILRNYPVLGHIRFLMEDVRPELQQYFVERNTDGRPFDRVTRSAVYQRAKGDRDDHPFGTERDLYAAGAEYLVHSMAPVEPAAEPLRVRVGGPDCTQPYDLALLNVSAMSFGSLSANAIEALSRGAAIGGFAHDTGEGAISPYHRRGGGDLIWEIGSGYFGCRTEDGGFDAERFAAQAQDPQVRMVHLKLSQGAKPGLGGVLPGAKVTREIAETRGVPVGQTVISPPAHRLFSTPRELMRTVARLRELSGGKPTGFKLCVGSRVEVLALCRAMLEEGVTPDFVVVDGAEGGTGAAPLEWVDRVGLPLAEGLAIVHQALVGTGLREHVRVGAAGKVATGADIVTRMVQGADFTMAARSMMLAVGCIQAQTCHTNTCPTGVATQDLRRQRALHVPSKAERVARYQAETVLQAQHLLASMGLASPAELRPHHLQRRTGPFTVVSYSDLVEQLTPGQLLTTPPPTWAADWAAADADRFGT